MDLLVLLNLRAEQCKIRLENFVGRFYVYNCYWASCPLAHVRGARVYPETKEMNIVRYRIVCVVCFFVFSVLPLRCRRVSLLAQ